MPDLQLTKGTKGIGLPKGKQILILSDIIYSPAPYDLKIFSGAYLLCSKKRKRCDVRHPKAHRNSRDVAWFPFVSVVMHH